MVSIDAVRLLESTYKKRDYPVFRGGQFDLNLFAIRGRRDTNEFDDLIGCHAIVGGAVQMWVWPGTTDPGFYYLQNPINSEGTAIIAPGFYPGLWAIGLHKASYEALVQVGTVSVYRDGDRDTKVDMDKPAKRVSSAGINCHRSTTTPGKPAVKVDQWSAACVVHSTVEGFNEMMALARKQLRENSTWRTFSFALFDVKEDPELGAFFYRAG